jgi:hypothetical protein
MVTVLISDVTSITVDGVNICRPPGERYVAK